MSGLLEALDRMSARARSRKILRGVLLAFAALLLWGFSALIQERQYGFGLLVAAVLAVLSIVEFVLADVLLDRRFPRESARFLDRLLDKLATTSMEQEIQDALEDCVASFQGCDPALISSTIHLRVNVLDEAGDSDVPALIQLSDYTRSGLGGRRWRLFSPAKGVVGRCLRAEMKVWANFRTAAEYRVRMVHDFGYTAEEADKRTNTARSYLAFPLRDRTEVIGVMFFFTTEQQVFPLAASDDRLTECASRVTGLLRVGDVL